MLFRSAFAALDTLEAIAGKRKIAIMGDMLELGRYSVESHRAVGARAAQVADLLITVGFRARGMGEAALDSGMRDESVRAYEMDESQRVGAEVQNELRPGDVVLVKGSQSMRMERTVLEIMAQPENAEELLVRQSDEWLAKS